MAHEPRDFEGQGALITGATSGIGQAIAVKLAALGASLTVTGRRKDLLDALVAEIVAQGGKAQAVVGDVREETHATEAVEKTVKTFGNLTLLVNNAGVIGAGPIEDTTTEEWDRILDVDLKGPFLFSRAAIPYLKDREGAAIVNVSSVTGRRPYAGIAPYCVAKAGLDMFTKCLALEMAPHGVRVNAINPGVVRTNLHTATGTVTDYDAFLERSRETHPLGFVGEPEDAAELVSFLLSPRARWITGGLYALDGGRELTSLR